MKRLVFDLETSPNLADVWSLWNQNVSLSQLRETSRVICWAAKWTDSPKVLFASEFHDGREAMVKKAWELLDEADAVVSWNGAAFDMKHMRREFLLAELGPPSPTHDIDLLLTVRKQFRFASNKLDHVSQQLLDQRKVTHAGHGLWVACMSGDEKAWAKMRTYCKHDVVLTGMVYERLKPWITGHPSIALFRDGEADVDVCARCGSDRLQRRGYATTALGKYPRFQCQGCGGWLRGNSRALGAGVRGI